jgi:hypothetical protein
MSQEQPGPKGAARIVRANVAKETALMTDEARQYIEIGTEFKSHESVNHSIEEYVRGRAHTNTVEGYYLLVSHQVLALASLAFLVN